MFSCEFGEISKNTFSYKTPPVAASEKNKLNLNIRCSEVLKLFLKKKKKLQVESSSHHLLHYSNSSEEQFFIWLNLINQYFTTFFYFFVCHDFFLGIEYIHWLLLILCYRVNVWHRKKYPILCKLVSIQLNKSNYSQNCWERHTERGIIALKKQ